MASKKAKQAEHQSRTIQQGRERKGPEPDSGDPLAHGRSPMKEGAPRDLGETRGHSGRK